MKAKWSFGLRMWALKQAKALLKKEQAEIESRQAPITPLDSHIEKHLTVPVNATEPVKETSFVVKENNPLERALQHIRAQHGEQVAEAFKNIERIAKGQ